LGWQRDLSPQAHNAFSIQCKGKRINAARNLAQRTALTAGHLSRF